MSSTRHIRRAARRREAHDRTGFVVGWCRTEGDLEECRASTHDALIRIMGDRRTGRVGWRQYEGDDAQALLDRLADHENRPELSDHYRRLRAHLREYGGWLVVAEAPGWTW